MYPVFLTFSVSLFDIRHLLTFSRSVLGFCSISTDEFLWQEIFVSSANIEAFVNVKQFGKSLIYILGRVMAQGLTLAGLRK